MHANNDPLGVRSAAELCEASQVSIWRMADGGYRFAAGFGHSAKRSAFLQDLRTGAGRGTVLGRVVLEQRPIQVAEVQADPEYDTTIARSGDNRAILGVLLLREGTPIGVLLLLRPTILPFTERQIELATTFADQAVIAIENVRLFDEIQEKSRQLEEASQHKSQFLANMSYASAQCYPRLHRIARGWRLWRAIRENARRTQTP